MKISPILHDIDKEIKLNKKTWIKLDAQLQKPNLCHCKRESLKEQRQNYRMYIDGLERARSIILG